MQQLGRQRVPWAAGAPTRLPPRVLHTWCPTSPSCPLLTHSKVKEITDEPKVVFTRTRKGQAPKEVSIDVWVLFVPATVQQGKCAPVRFL